MRPCLQRQMPQIPSAHRLRGRAATRLRGCFESTPPLHSRRTALATLELWYAHQLTTTFMLTNSGKGASYHERGWPTYESGMSTLIKEVSTFLCYEATKDLPLEACDVQTLCGAERGLRIAQRVGVVPVLRGGLGQHRRDLELVAWPQLLQLLRRPAVVVTCGGGGGA